MFKYLGILGGKNQIKNLGAFMVAIFGIVDLFLEFGGEPVEPYWVLWFFRVGIILGFVLLIGGSFASDISD
jgi:hypothetical protein